MKSVPAYVLLLRLGILPSVAAIALTGLVPGVASADAQAKAVPAAAAAQAAVSDSFMLGRDRGGDPCAANAVYDDKEVAKYDRVFLITCRGTAAGRTQGKIVAYSARYTRPKFNLTCGAEIEVAVADIGKVKARRCFDPVAGASVVMETVTRNGVVYTGWTISTAVAPLETGLRTLIDQTVINDRYYTREPSLAIESLPAMAEQASAPPAGTQQDSDFNPNVILSEGIRRNQEGAYTEASRTLNDALSRIGPEVPVATRAEFNLEAAIADSNIGLTESADAHFDTARTLLSTATQDAAAGADGGGKVGTVTPTAFLVRKQSTYEALDAINRRQWFKALEKLRTGETTGNPLEDPAMLSALNQSLPSEAARATRQEALADRGELRNELLEAQRYWAASIAWLALASDRTVASGDLAKLPELQSCPTKATAHGAGDRGQLVATVGDRAVYYDRSAAALDCAVELVNVLQRNVQPSALLPIKSRIQRQYGRLQSSEKRIPDAIKSFDCALAMLEGGQLAPAAQAACVFNMAGAQSAASAPAAYAGPIIAATEMERANVLSNSSAPSAEVIKAFESAVNSKLVSGDAGERQTTELERYLDILVKSYAADPRSETAELYFRALQTIGEPAVARQVAELQKVVTTNNELGAKVRDRAELERRLVQLRYQLGGSTVLDAPTREKLEAERRTAENMHDKIEADLDNDPHFKTVDDQTVQVSQIRSVLQSGEYYLKVTLLSKKAYGIVIGQGRTFIYTVVVPADKLRSTVKDVRESIRSEVSTKRPRYDVRSAYAVYALLTGPAAETVRLARSLIVDPSGPLEKLPAGVLVVTPQSVRDYYKSADADDLSHVDFLARRTDISYALSPRTLLIIRGLKPSSATQDFIGFGQNAPPPLASAATAGRQINISGCSMDYNTYVGLMANSQPVSAGEIGLAATALGVPGAPEVTQAAFTDTGILQASDNGDYKQYQVVHFATHGIPESPLPNGCNIPPSLITTVAPVDASGDIVSDGLLTFPDVARMHFDANLVVLSACDTAAGVSNATGMRLGQEESGATLDGLVRAFITAQARAVLATYWQVPATPDTDTLIQTFYRGGKIYPMSKALTTAQRTLMGQAATSHPYFWGAYVLIGDGSKTMLTPKPVQTAAR